MALISPNSHQSFSSETWRTEREITKPQLTRIGNSLCADFSTTERRSHSLTIFNVFFFSKPLNSTHSVIKNRVFRNRKEKFPLQTVPLINVCLRMREMCCGNLSQQAAWIGGYSVMGSESVIEKEKAEEILMRDRELFSPGSSWWLSKGTDVPSRVQLAKWP